MKYLAISNQLYTDNRARFAKQLKAKSLAIFNSNDVMPTNADGHMGFKQNSDLFRVLSFQVCKAVFFLLN